jgi:type VI secretion system protein ImpF
MRSERPVVQSLLDRLIDLEPKLRDDPAVSRGQSVRDLKVSLQRDLEWLLNTRQTIQHLPESAEELRNSLFGYGLPEFAGLSLSTAAEVLSNCIESTVRTFEPRLSNVHVSMRPVEGVDRIAHFTIEAILLLDPMPEHVVFDTVLEISKGEYRVKGES